MNALVLWCTLSLLSAGASGEYDDYGEALQAARRQGRPLIVVLYRRSEAKTAVPVGESLGRLRRRFVICRVNVETPSGAQLARAFRRDRFPHVAVIDARQMVILQRHAGPLDVRTAQQLLARWSPAATASEPVSSGSVICFT